jgi:DNA-binding NarL/FixJ family response regulator
MEKKVTILIADEHYLIRQGLRFIFDSKSSRFHVVHETDDYTTVIPLIDIYDPDVVVIGLNIHGVEAMPVIQEVLKKHPRQKVLVLDSNENIQEVIQILQMGVHAYILKQCDHQEIVDAVESIMVGKNFFCSNVLKLNHKKQEDDCEGHVIESAGPIHLSEREIQILGLIAEGLTNKEIADKTFISSHTVASHRKNLMKKFRAKNNVDLVISAIRDNFIAP